MFKISTEIRMVKNNKTGQFEERRVKAFVGRARLSANPPEIREAKGFKVMKAFGFSGAIHKNKGGLIINVDPSRDKYRETKDTLWFPLELWEKNAENMAKLGFKGQQLYIFGRIETQKYKSKDGEEKEIEVLVVEQFDVLEYNNEGNKGEESGEASGNNTSQETGNSQQQSTGKNQEQNTSEDIIEEVNENEGLTPLNEDNGDINFDDIPF